MFSTFALFKALPLALMLSTAFAGPVPETSSTSDVEKRIVGNEATFLVCVTTDWRCGYFSTYTNGEARQTVKWTTGNKSTNLKVVSSNQDWCLYEAYRKHTNDAGYWFNADMHWKGVSHTIGFDPTGNSIKLGDATWGSTDQAYLNGRCENEFGSDYASVAPDYGSGELNWTDLSDKLY
ncbi:hypothetical protein SEPCBS119000_006616 [Sporothrix epigloea]|uniref:Uncharacterized protein n=1 Tax=Sporothrix epigloea TaxID=1892477 RepID=A0ABP0E3Y6_9PEZI